MSVRVVRWDTGREAEVPEEALRWGPDTRQGTCRAQLLRPRPSFNERDASYVLPFAGAKWAVRVTISALDDPRPFPAPPYFTADYTFAAHVFRGSSESSREKLGALLEAAGDALRAEEGRPKAPGDGRSIPDDTALSLLAECLDECLFPAGLSRRVQLFLKRETSAEIRRAWKGGGRG